jgi:hypothetical protein
VATTPWPNTYLHLALDVLGDDATRNPAGHPRAPPVRRPGNANGFTGRDANGPLVTQKSNNRHNVPMATYIAIAQSQGKTRIIWYGLVT